jgi:hypothetical protein
MLVLRLRSFLAEVLLRWQGGGDLPQDHDDDDGPRWYDLPHWC